MKRTLSFSLIGLSWVLLDGARLEAKLSAEKLQKTADASQDSVRAGDDGPLEGRRDDVAKDFDGLNDTENRAGVVSGSGGSGKTGPGLTARDSNKKGAAAVAISPDIDVVRILLAEKKKALADAQEKKADGMVVMVAGSLFGAILILMGLASVGNPLPGLAVGGGGLIIGACMRSEGKEQVKSLQADVDTLEKKLPPRN